MRLGVSGADNPAVIALRQMLRSLSQSQDGSGEISGKNIADEARNQKADTPPQCDAQGPDPSRGTVAFRSFHRINVLAATRSLQLHDCVGEAVSGADV